jgi:hypothetical protein
VEEKPPQQKPNGTVFREKHEQFVKTELCADRRLTRREHLRDTKNRLGKEQGQGPPGMKRFRLLGVAAAILGRGRRRGSKAEHRWEKKRRKSEQGSLQKNSKALA